MNVIASGIVITSYSIHYTKLYESELKERILSILHKPQLAALATVTEMGNPWVRYVVTVGDGDLIIRCATFADSRKVKHIEGRSDVHLTCGRNNFV